jgi:hypothetical protein
MTMSRAKEIEMFKTADLPLAAALCVAGFIVEEMERSDARRSIFIFENSAELQEQIRRYWRGAILVEPQAYFSQCKALKARIYEYERKAHE